LAKRRSKKAGLPPGSLVHVGNTSPDAPVRVRATYFNQERISESTIDCSGPIDLIKTNDNLWVDVEGIHRPDVIQNIGDQFGLHPLVLEDILNSLQRPKKEIYDDFIFVVVRGLKGAETEQVSFALGKGWLLSFREGPSSIFDRTYERLRAGKSKLRSGSVDYLLYMLIDGIVDDYFLALEELGDKQELIEQKLVNVSAPLENKMLPEIYNLKRRVLVLRRAIWPMREVVSGLGREESEKFCPSIKIYLRDVYDHVVEIIDIIEVLRETSSNMLELYISAVNHRVNEVSKLLTMIATVFLPLTFITGIYGMNFEFMPELKSPYGYPTVLIVCLVLSLSMLFYFKRKRWW
jgi:magnesium transporter